MCNYFLGISAKEVANFQYILSFKSSDMISSPCDFIDAFKHESVLNANDSTYVSFVFLPVMSKVLSCSIKLLYGKSLQISFSICFLEFIVLNLNFLMLL